MSAEAIDLRCRVLLQQLRDQPPNAIEQGPCPRLSQIRRLLHATDYRLRNQLVDNAVRNADERACRMLLQWWWNEILNARNIGNISDVAQGAQTGPDIGHMTPETVELWQRLDALMQEG